MNSAGRTTLAGQAANYANDAKQLFAALALLAAPLRIFITNSQEATVKSFAVAEIVNWRVQKLILHPEKTQTRTSN
jgi:hypothetical protein